MSSADRAIRWSTIAAVAIVALVAAFVSYRHALEVVRVHGESGPVAQLYPLTVDGLIYAASMVLLDAARRSVRPPTLAYVALGLGITATLAANVAAGITYGAVGAIVAAWPAPALVISYELLMLIIRGSATAPQTAPEPVPAAPRPAPADDEMNESSSRAVPASLNGHARAAAQTFAVDLAEGRVPGIQWIRDELAIGQDEAQQVEAYLRTLARTA